MLRVCQQSASTYLKRSFLLLVTAASDLLVHKILLNSVQLSRIVSGGVRPKPPRQTPQGHNPSCFLPFVGRLGSGPRLVSRIGSGVRVSVSFQQKYPPGSVLRCPTTAENGVMTKVVVSGVGGRGGVDLRLRRITSSPSQTLRRRLVRTTNDGRCGVLGSTPSVAALFFTLRMYAAIFVQNRVFAYPTCIRRPRQGGSRRNIAIPFGMEKLEWLGYPMV